LQKGTQKARREVFHQPKFSMEDSKINGLQATLCGELVPRILRLANIPMAKIFFSSHVVPDVSNNLSQHMKINLDGNDSVKGDVKTFIKYRVNALGGWDDGLKT